MAGVAFVAVLFALGCATSRPVSSGEPSRASVVVEQPAAPPARVNSGSPCLPPGVAADFFTWPVRSFKALAIPRDDETVIPGAWVLYGKGDSRVAAVWGGEELIAIDPSPTTDAPMWVDRGLIDAETRALRSETGNPCQWRQQGERRL
jgi:hypothetical protein